MGLTYIEEVGEAPSHLPLSLVQFNLLLREIAPGPPIQADEPSPNSCTACARSLFFCTLPLAVMPMASKSPTMRRYRGTRKLAQRSLHQAMSSPSSACWPSLSVT